MSKQKKSAISYYKKNQKKSSLKKSKLSKGVIDAGTVYGVLLLALVLGGAYMMLGNIDPNTASPDQGQPVIVQNATDNSTHSNLQLKDFVAITLTPSPSPTPTPTPTPTMPPAPAPASGGGGGGGGGGNPGSCFVAGTKILMADMTDKNIEDVKPEDMVMSYDGKDLIKEKVEQVEAPIRDHHDNLHLEDGTELGFTDDHPIYTENGWEAINPEEAKHESPGLIIGQLKEGDKVLKSDGQYVKILSWEHIPGDIQTYNLKRVSNHNTYYANGILVHNKGGGGGGGSGGGGGGGGGGGDGFNIKSNLNNTLSYKDGSE